MITRFIGMKEFRNTLSVTLKKAKKNNITYVVLRKNIPVCEVRPLDEKKFAMQKFVQEIDEALEQVKQGKVYSQDEIMQEFDLL